MVLTPPTVLIPLNRLPRRVYPRIPRNPRVDARVHLVPDHRVDHEEREEGREEGDEGRAICMKG